MQVDVEHHCHVLRGQPVGAATVHHSGRVHEPAEAAECGAAGVQCGCVPVFVGDVDVQCHGGDVVGVGNPRGGFVCRVAVHVPQGNGPTGGGQCLRAGESDAGRTAGHDDSGGGCCGRGHGCLLRWRRRRFRWFPFRGLARTWSRLWSTYSRRSSSGGTGRRRGRGLQVTGDGRVRGADRGRSA